MIAIDIETYCDETMIELLPPVEPDSRLKDEEKIKADIEKKKQKQIESMALNPLFGKIACIGYYSSKVQEVDFGEEKELIERFIGKTDLLEDIVITWNGNKFDIPFLFKRGIKYGLLNLRGLQHWTKRNSEIHTDLMELWAGYGQYEKLDTIAKCLLGSDMHKEEFDVKEIPTLIKTASGKELIRRYCLRDCELLYKLGEKLL